MGMTAAELRALLDVAREYRLVSLKVGDVEAFFHASVFAAAPEPAGEVVPVNCPCGHDLDVEHGEHGLCLRGCDERKCHPEATP